MADIKVHFLGAEIGNPLSMKQLLAGIRSSQALMAWFDSQGIRFIEKNDTWISTNAYRKELHRKNHLPDAGSKKKELKRDKFSLDLNISSLHNLLGKSLAFHSTNIKDFNYWIILPVFEFSRDPKRFMESFF